jgi:diadenosine tetraphosphate (Ap4A) HIT family hydrolase
MSSPGSETAPDCLICRQVAGEVDGGLLIDAPLVTGFHASVIPQNPRPLLGHLFVSPRRHAAGFEDLEAREAAAVGVAVSRLARALRDTLDLERVYTASIGHAYAHMHVHLLPRYAGTPPDVPWVELDEWEGAPHGGEDAIAELAGRLRAVLA